MNETSEQQRTGTDPVTREVILSGVKAAVAEMEVLIGRAAMSPVIRDKKDYFMGVYDARGRMVHALTSYSGPGLVKPVLDRFAPADIAPGDVFFYNDPYSTDGAVQHLPDVVVLMPFHDRDERLIGFTVAFGHLEDIGGLRYGSGAMDAADIFNEGVAYPPMRVGRRGDVDDWFLALLTRNSRCPDLVRGDWRALHAGAQLGVDRMAELLARWGTAAVLDTADWTIDRSAGRVRRILRDRIADGEYEATHYADGTAIGRPQIAISARLTKSADRFTLDLTGSDDQVPAPLNYLASLPVTQLLMLMQLLVIDGELGTDQGALSNLTDLVVRPGSVVAPHFPAPLNSRAVPRSALVACLADVLAQADGGWMTAPAPSHVLAHFSFPGGKGFGETLGVGLGARPYGDGPDVIYGLAQRNYPVEQLEPTVPLRVERYEIRQDTGGPGRFRGGCGVRRSLRLLTDASVSPRVGNTAIASPGIAGGHPGGLGQVTVVDGHGERRTYPGVYGDIALRAGDLVVLESTGGGGWGDPLTRPADDVLRDVREGFVSGEHAAQVYGVVVRDGRLDETATAVGPRSAVGP